MIEDKTGDSYKFIRDLLVEDGSGHVSIDDGVFLCTASFFEHSGEAQFDTPPDLEERLVALIDKVKAKVLNINDLRAGRATPSQIVFMLDQGGVTSITTRKNGLDIETLLTEPMTKAAMINYLAQTIRRALPSSNVE